MNLRNSSLVAAAFLACTPAVRAVRPAAAPAATPAEASKTDTKLEIPKSNEPAPPYELKNRSTFANAINVARAPFWPIGWVKRSKASTMAAAQPQMEAPKVTLDAKNFKVTSILLGSGTTPSLAVINGRAYSEGEYIRMPKAAGAAAPRIRVQHIADGSIILQGTDQSVTVPLQRPELSSPKPELLLNEQDR